MELKNMTNKELVELKNKINTELNNREDKKKEDFKNKLIDLIHEIADNDLNIHFFGYNIDLSYDTEIIMGKSWGIGDIIID